jgi:hypothetical protein
VHFKQHIINNAPPGTLGLATKTGSMDSDLCGVIKLFIWCSSSSKDSPSLLILDSHECHLSIEAKDKGLSCYLYLPTPQIDLSLWMLGYSHSKDLALNSKLLQKKGFPVSVYDVAGCVSFPE